MSAFAENILSCKGNEHPTLFDAIKAAADTMSPFERATAYKRTGHGVCVYTQEEQLNAYLVAYGEMHKAKLEAVLNGLGPAAFEMFRQRGVSIVDWGCGQGLATLSVLDWFGSHGLGDIEVKAVRLLEMSDVARERANALVSQRIGSGAGGVVADMPWIAGEPLTFDAFSLPPGVPVLHLFSNILDVFEIDLKNVVAVVETMKNCGPSLVVSVSPKNYGSSRIGVFWQMLGTPKCLAKAPEHVSLQGAVYIHNLKTCTAVGLGYALNGLPQPDLLSRISIFHVFDLGGASDVAFGSYPCEWGAYCYSMPAEEECAAHPDESLQSVLAVLGNMVARGNPSRASVETERRLARELGLTRANGEEGGSIRFEFLDAESSEKAMESVIGRMSPFAPRPGFTKRLLPVTFPASFLCRSSCGNPAAVPGNLWKKCWLRQALIRTVWISGRK